MVKSISNDGTVDVVLNDFDTARETNTGTVLTTSIGKFVYCAPEVKTGEYDARVDVWAAGVVLYELMTRKHDFNICDDIKADQDEKHKKLRKNMSVS
jgi:serine/threonine protein kinase